MTLTATMSNNNNPPTIAQVTSVLQSVSQMIPVLYRKESDRGQLSSMLTNFAKASILPVAKTQPAVPKLQLSYPALLQCKRAKENPNLSSGPLKGGYRSPEKGPHPCQIPSARQPFTQLCQQSSFKAR